MAPFMSSGAKRRRSTWAVGAARLLWITSTACAAAPAPAPATFYQDIAPILHKNCASCHRPGESGPFPLLTYDDARKRAAQIAAVTKSRFMPPWLPEPGHGEFTEEHRLSDTQIARIQDWAAQGAPAGNAAGFSIPKFSSGWQLGPPDLILRPAKGYKLAADGPEFWWNFILPVPITTTRWVRAIEVRTSNPKVFHHANVLLDRAHGARRMEAEPGAGFPGMNLSFEEESYDPDGHFLAWKPGSEPVQEPDGMAWRADPGMDLILNCHMRPTGKEEVVSPVIGLYFTNKVQTRFPLLIQLEHDGILDIPPGARDFLVTDNFRIPMDVNILAVYPHAHYLGKTLEAFATLPDGTKKWLVRIPDWDLSWQGVFRLKKPLFLPKDSVVSMSYHYDNSAGNKRNPSSPPVRVVAGNSSTNEMGHFWFQALPVADGDHRAELHQAYVRQRLEKYPDDFMANFSMGDLLMNQKKPGEAIPYFERAATTDPNSALAFTEWGVALFSAGQAKEAEGKLRRALELNPRYTDARFDLGSVQAAMGYWEDAAKSFVQVIAERPDHATAAGHLGEVYVLWGDEFAKSGKDDEAIARYREALPIRGDTDPDLHGRIGMAYARQDKLAESQAAFEAMLKLNPNSQLAKDALAAIAKRRKELGK
jgi:cytochrome c-type biogenesis protein CcmH/NrfG/mono/diheme cytochrome c family protein